MWSAIAALFLAGFKWLFGGKQQAAGEAQGKAEAQGAGLEKELEDEAAAQKARNDADDSFPDSVLDDPNNRGPK